MDRKIVQRLIQKKSFNSISRDLKVSKKRVRKLFDLANEAGYLDQTPLPSFPQPIFDYSKDKLNGPVSEVDKQLLQYKQWMTDRREAGWHWITIYEELPIKVQQSSYYRFIDRHKLNEDKEKGRCRVKVVSEILYAPAESLILDWGKLRDVIDPKTGKKRTVWFLAGVFGFSRYMMVRFVWDNKVVTTLDALESMFNEVGGTPQRLTSDNPKCFATKASKYEPILNPAFERFCEHYQTTPELLPPRSPEKKGKIERMVPYVRRLFEAFPGSDWSSLIEAQEYMDKKIKLANQRKHGTTKLRPVDVFLEQEASELNMLPNTSFEREEYSWAKVRKDGHVRFSNKYYSLDKAHVGKEVFVIGTRNNVQVYLDGQLIESHQRLINKHQSKSTKKHHLESREQILGETGHYIKRAEKLGPQVKELIEAILLKGQGFIDHRKVWGILSLDKDHNPEQINEACQFAINCGQLSYQTVVSFLNLLPKQKTALIKPTSQNYSRDIQDYSGIVDKQMH